MKVLHVITCLNDGGAEVALFRLIANTPHFHHCVVSLAGLGKYGVLLKEIEVDVVDLDMGSFAKKFSAVFRLAYLVRLIRPDVIQSWMYHADLIAGIAGRLVGFKNITWGLHNSTVSLGDNTLQRFALIRLNAILSYVIPNTIVSCSQAALYAHRDIGYNAKRLLFVPNGYPVGTFFPDEKTRRKTRVDFGVDDDEVLLGMVARLDPLKDHINLLNSLAILKETQKFKCLLVGTGLEPDSQLLPEIESRGLGDYVLLVGPRADIPGVMNALDVYVSSSWSEAFPNVLCEAMACGVPCVVTDVGDSAFIVGDTGWIVPRRSPEQLAASLVCAIANLADTERKAAARRRIVEKFSIDRMAELYRLVWTRKDPPLSCSAPVE